MSFAQAVRTCLSKYATFDGRARRSEYWWFYLFAAIVYVIAFVLGRASSLVIPLLVDLALFLPVLAAGVRRLHDTNRSGWWVLIGFIPLIGAIILIVYLASDSDHAPNQYGPEPASQAAV